MENRASVEAANLKANTAEAQSRSIERLIGAGFTKASVVEAVAACDMSLLKPTKPLPGGAGRPRR